MSQSDHQTKTWERLIQIKPLLQGRRVYPDHQGGPVRQLKQGLNKDREFWDNSQNSTPKWDVRTCSISARKRSRKIRRDARAIESHLRRGLSVQGRYAAIAELLSSSDKAKLNTVWLTHSDYETLSLAKEALVRKKRPQSKNTKRHQAFEQKPRPRWTKEAITLSRSLKSLSKSDWAAIESQASLSGLVTPRIIHQFV